MSRTTRQRQIILRELRGTNAHPTAAWLYERVRAEMPHISLGTVYRNLAKLSGEGAILSLNIGDGVERFDGTISPHAHFYCEKCGLVSDLALPPAEEQIRALEAAEGLTVRRYQLNISGVCRDCRKRDESGHQPKGAQVRPGLTI